MLHPSYTDLMKVVNQDVEEGESKVVTAGIPLLWQRPKERDS